MYIIIRLVHSIFYCTIIYIEADTSAAATPKQKKKRSHKSKHRKHSTKHRKHSTNHNKHANRKSPPTEISGILEAPAAVQSALQGAEGAVQQVQEEAPAAAHPSLHGAEVAVQQVPEETSAAVHPTLQGAEMAVQQVQEVHAAPAPPLNTNSVYESAPTTLPDSVPRHTAASSITASDDNLPNSTLTLENISAVSKIVQTPLPSASVAANDAVGTDSSILDQMSTPMSEHAVTPERKERTSRFRTGGKYNNIIYDSTYYNIYIFFAERVFTAERDAFNESAFLANRERIRLLRATLDGTIYCRFI